tara:strand:+ start:334 stop:570 length:237 start_codon:yes stop_codon:yes gene_type:complete
MDIYGLQNEDIEMNNMLRKPLNMNRQKRNHNPSSRSNSKQKGNFPAAFTYLTQVHQDMAGLKSNNGDSRFETGPDVRT